MRRMEKTLAILVALVLGLGLAACGSDSDSDSSPSNPVEGVEWELMNIASSKEGWAIGVPAEAPTPTVEFSDGNVQVFTGCNSGTGPAEIGKSSIRMGPIPLTKKSCDQTSNQVESIVSQVLTGTVTYKIADGKLTLSHGGYQLIFNQGDDASE